MSKYAKFMLSIVLMQSMVSASVPVANFANLQKKYPGLKKDIINNMKYDFLTSDVMIAPLSEPYYKEIAGVTYQIPKNVMLAIYQKAAQGQQMGDCFGDMVRVEIRKYKRENKLSSHDHRKMSDANYSRVVNKMKKRSSTN